MDQVHGWFAYSLSLAMAHHVHTHPEDQVVLYFSSGTLIQQSREQLARKAIDWASDYSIWFDSDMRFPKEVISTLISHDEDIVGANYPTRKFPRIEPTAFVDDTSNTRCYTKERTSGLEEVSAIGFGCVAIKTSVFEALEEPWFLIPWSYDFNEHDCGEDVFFCRLARDNGLKIYVDHDLSKKVKHIGNREYSYLDVHGDHELQ